ncbi:hypothetical protein F4780DRAFT_795364 [Xylariomycetidae sp. FL0641]|nr:hypothetical protein F4780DRAFT_795364 [Xylariomycetidae sp. FL0641]
MNSTNPPPAAKGSQAAHAINRGAEQILKRILPPSTDTAHDSKAQRSPLNDPFHFEAQGLVSPSVISLASYDEEPRETTFVPEPKHAQNTSRDKSLDKAERAANRQIDRLDRMFRPTLETLSYGTGMAGKNKAKGKKTKRSREADTSKGKSYKGM